jgi:hypothetical protein
MRIALWMEGQGWMSIEQIGQGALKIPRSQAHRAAAGPLKKLSIMGFVERKGIANIGWSYRRTDKILPSRI